MRLSVVEKLGRSPEKIVFSICMYTWWTLSLHIIMEQLYSLSIYTIGIHISEKWHSLSFHTIPLNISERQKSVGTWHRSTSCHQIGRELHMTEAWMIKTQEHDYHHHRYRHRNDCNHNHHHDCDRHHHHHHQYHDAIFKPWSPVDAYEVDAGILERST